VQQSQCRGSNETDAARLSHGPPSRGISAFRPSRSPRGISNLYPEGARAWRWRRDRRSSRGCEVGAISARSAASHRAIIDFVNALRIVKRSNRRYAEEACSANVTRQRRASLDPRELAHQKSQKRTAAALPKRMQAVIETGNELVKEAKGLGHGARQS
jgi:hypothetical protein